MLLMISDNDKLFFRKVNSFPQDDPIWIFDLVALWRGYEYVSSSSNLFLKLLCGNSLNKTLILGLAKNCKLKNENSDYGIGYIFGRYSGIIIPALCEMGIFKDISTLLLREAEKLPLSKRKEIATIISRSEVDEALKIYLTSINYQAHVWKNGGQTFLDRRFDFCKTLDFNF